LRSRFLKNVKKFSGLLPNICITLANRFLTRYFGKGKTEFRFRGNSRNEISFVLKKIQIADGRLNIDFLRNIKQSKRDCRIK